MPDLKYAEMIPKWIGSESKEFSFPDYTRIDVPLLDSHNDFNSIYIIPQTDGSFRISDNASSFCGLVNDGVDMTSVNSRWALALNSLILSLGVSMSDSTHELFIVCRKEELHAKMGFFIQAMIRVECLSPVSRIVLAEQKQRMKLRNRFKNLLDLNSGKYEEDVSCHGSSGMNHSFDFLLKGKHNDSYVRLMQRPTKELKESLIFEWDDVRGFVGNSSLFAVKEKEENRKEETVKLDEVMYNRGISILSLDRDAGAIVKYLIA